MDELYKKDENFVLNSEMCVDSMNDFGSFYNLKCLINKPTCLKSTDHPTCIGLMLTNKYRSFQNTSIIETGLSDFYKFTVSVMKMNYQKTNSNNSLL